MLAARFLRHACRCSFFQKVFYPMQDSLLCEALTNRGQTMKILLTFCLY